MREKHIEYIGNKKIAQIQRRLEDCILVIESHPFRLLDVMVCRRFGF